MAATSQAVSLLLKAQKSLEKASSSASSGFSKWFSSSSANYEATGDLFQQSGNQFKLEKRYKEAGDAFKEEAKCREAMGDDARNEAANAWWQAAKAYKQGFPDLAVDALSHTIKHFCATGKFRQAADREKEIAQIYVKELNDVKRGCESYDQAAEWYDQEDSKATATSCRRDAADLYAELGEYDLAIERYRKVADSYMDSPLTRFNVKEIWLREGLCALAKGDYAQASNLLARTRTVDPTFQTTREAKFLSTLTDAVSQGDVEMFTNALVEWDHVSKLDNWKTAILLAAKAKLLSAEQDDYR
ncbi:Vesicular-fusion protein SEC17 [Serendipita indica DSM 11827]|uniref:Probable SEC17-transport vesicle fusion protein n=1 Tax=Serendipita indica (strain DSM 11827) TaxID=1109443 RepID=G4T7K7_SERID|nr:Vesicular-fusion protein SEC17 [Serendipita indica DSM 11827]CCA67306.1 probable SEC17-transport vesicle fusion protein [Serendipita indica DSM 11827]